MGRGKPGELVVNVVEHGNAAGDPI